MLAFNHLAAEITTRMMRPCLYDEPLLVHARIASLGRSSTTFEHALTGSAAPHDIRAVASIAVVIADAGEAPTPWTHGQRTKLAAFDGGALDRSTNVKPRHS